MAFFLKQSWGGVGKRVERDGSFCMRDQCFLTNAGKYGEYAVKSLGTIESEAGLGLGLGLRLGMYDIVKEPIYKVLWVVSKK